MIRFLKSLFSPKHVPPPTVDILAIFKRWNTKPLCGTCGESLLDGQHSAIEMHLPTGILPITGCPRAPEGRAYFR